MPGYHVKPDGEMTAPKRGGWLGWREENSATLLIGCTTLAMWLGLHMRGLPRGCTAPVPTRTRTTMHTR